MITPLLVYIVINFIGVALAKELRTIIVRYARRPPGIRSITCRSIITSVNNNHTISTWIVINVYASITRVLKLKDREVPTKITMTIIALVDVMLLAFLMMPIFLLSFILRSSVHIRKIGG